MENSKASTAKMQADMERMQQMAQREKLQARRWEEEQIAAIDARANQIQELNLLGISQVTNAQIANKNAVEKGNIIATKMKQYMRSENDIIDANHSRRIDAVLSLKDNIAISRKEVKDSADKNVQTRNDLLQELENEKAEMLSRGLNPYVEFRRREIENEADIKSKKIKKNILKNQKDIALRLEKDMKLEEKNKKDLDSGCFSRESQGRSVVEARTSKYISKITSKNVDIIDPSGRSSLIDIQPSQITDIPDYSFGLGKSSRIPNENMKRITEQIRENLKIDKEDLGEYKRLVSKLQLQPGKEKTNINDVKENSMNKKNNNNAINDNNNNDNNNNKNNNNIHKDINSKETEIRNDERKRLSELQHLASQKGETPGAFGVAVDLNFCWQEEQERDIESKKILKINNEENSNNSYNNKMNIKSNNKQINNIYQNNNTNINAYDNYNNNDNDNDNVNEQLKYSSIVLSKFEKDAFNKAKERQQNRIKNGQIQTAAGKIFSGFGFSSKSREIIFKDFCVGKKYKQKFLFTNVSLGLNSFRLLNLNDNVIDFFDIKYEKLGRVSAGVGINVEIDFAPKVNEDIHTVISFSSETGQGEMPLHCYIKRCAPKVESIFIDFGKMTIGQEMILPLKIKNSQILPSSFSISRVLYGVDRKDDFDIEKNTRNKSVLLNINEIIETDFFDKNENSNARKNESDYNENESVNDCNDEIEKNLGSNPAKNSAELTLRIENIINNKMKLKKQKHPEPFSIKMKKNNDSESKKSEIMKSPIFTDNDDEIDNIGKDYQNNLPDDGEGFIEGYSSVILDVLCAPLVIGPIEHQFSMIFNNVKNSMKSTDDNGNLILKEQLITIRVEVEELPIYTKDKIIDMRCTLFDRTYRKKIEIFNRSSIACKVEVKISKMFLKFIDINPTTIYVQGEGSQTINIKMTPTLIMLKKLQYYSLLKKDFINSAVMSCPIELKMANQDLSEFFLLNTTVTQSTILCSNCILNYNKVYINQKISLPLIVTNTSLLPQKISFIKLRKEISIQPNDGFLILLPNEKHEFMISFCPSSATNYNFDLSLLTNFNDQINIKINAIGIECPLLLNKSIINFRTTCPGERIIENIIVQNKSIDHQLLCEIFIPDSRLSYLKVSPSIIDLLPLQKCRIEIEFFPPTDLFELNPKIWLSKLKEIMLSKDNIDEKNDIDNNNGNNNNNSNNSNNGKNSSSKNSTSNSNSNSNNNSSNSINDSNSKNNKNDKNNNDNINNDNDNIDKIAIGKGMKAALFLGSDIELNRIENNENHTTFGVFTDLEEDSGFITVKNSFGEVQWVRSQESVLKSDYDEFDKKMENNDISMNNLKFENSNNNNTENDRIENKSLRDEKITEKTKEVNKIKENEINELESDLAYDQWGVRGMWTLPIFIKTKNVKRMKNKNNDNNENNAKKKMNERENNREMVNNKNESNNCNESIENIQKKENMNNNNDDYNNNNNDDNNDINYNDLNNNDNDDNDILLPLFINMETMVTLPQIDCNVKIINFGQIAIGQRILKTILISNLSDNSINLSSNGLNSCGPFSILTPVKILNNNEYKKIVIECFPLYSGLYNEIIEFYNSNNLGGHRLRINLSVEGVLPCVTLLGLLSPSVHLWGKSNSNDNNNSDDNNNNNHNHNHNYNNSNNNNKSDNNANYSSSNNSNGHNNNNENGYLDFGNVLVDDVSIQYFTVLNNSTFPINVNIIRTVCAGLSPYEQLNEVTDRTISGLPLFSYRPESMRLKPGESQQIEVTFRPDCYRYLPYREELQIQKNFLSDENILKINLIGRSIGSQLFVLPQKPNSESFAYSLNNNNDNNSNNNNDNNNYNNDNFIGKGMLLINDVIASCSDISVKKAHHESLKYSNTILPNVLPIKLEFPDPYSDNTDPSLYTEIERKSIKQNTNKNTINDSNNKIIQKNDIARQQIQRVLISSILPRDNRAGSSAPGNFEIILSNDTKECGLWTVNSALISPTGKNPGNSNAPSTTTSTSTSTSTSSNGILTGQIHPGGVWGIDFICTLPPPKGIGGLCVGSWKTFDAEIILIEYRLFVVKIKFVNTVRPNLCVLYKCMNRLQKILKFTI